MAKCQLPMMVPEPMRFRHHPKGWKLEFDQLARFNAEKARGILHAEEYRRKMDAVQRDFNEQYRNDG